MKSCVPEIASLWSEGKRDSEILQQIADEVSYDQELAIEQEGGSYHLERMCSNQIMG
jgi:hypothetical protein